jgi:hypothetical protein
MAGVVLWPVTVMELAVMVPAVFSAARQPNARLSNVVMSGVFPATARRKRGDELMIYNRQEVLWPILKAARLPG